MDNSMHQKRPPACLSKRVVPICAAAVTLIYRTKNTCPIINVYFVYTLYDLCQNANEEVEEMDGEEEEDTSIEELTFLGEAHADSILEGLNELR